MMVSVHLVGHAQIAAPIALSISIIAQSAPTERTETKQLPSVHASSDTMMMGSPQTVKFVSTPANHASMLLLA